MSRVTRFFSTFFSGRKGDLTKGDLTDHLIRLSVPMTWGILMIISFQLVDTFYIAMLGTEKLAAFTFTFPVTFGIFSLIMGFGIAMSSVVSRLIGSGEQDTTRRVVTHGLICVLLLSIFASVIGLFFMEPIFRAIGADDAMLALIDDYMVIWFIGALTISLPIVGNSAMRAAGDTLMPAMIMTIVAVLNIILDPIFIFGLFGFPRMELQGAALATVIANAAAMVAGLYVLARREKLICLHYCFDFTGFADSLKRLLFIALPAGLTNAIQPVVNALIIGLLATSGTEAVAAYGIVTRVEAFAFIILMGVAVGMAPIVGQNYGAGLYSRVQNVITRAMRFGVIWSLGVAIILGVLARPVAGIFSDDPQVIHYATLFFWIVPLSYIFANLIRGWASAFNAMGQPQRSVLMIVVEMLFLMIPGIYLGYHIGGVMGLFIAIAAVNIIAGGVFHLWSWRYCRKLVAGADQPLVAE